jgi:hypothetical protein
MQPFVCIVSTIKTIKVLKMMKQDLNINKFIHPTNKKAQSPHGDWA